MQIKDEKVFCILPFIHTHLNTDGGIYPCCVGWTTDNRTKVGQLGEQTLEEAFNSKEMKELRLDLMNGERNYKFCEACYEREDNGFPSARIGNNNDFRDRQETILQNLNSDGSMTPVIKSWDIRYSNLCNLKCRSCGDLYSTKWAAETGSNTELKAFPAGQDPLVEQYDNVEKIYFAGGEPLIMPEHFETLSKLIESGRSKKVALVYNSNMTKLNYNKHDLLEYWKEFKTVTVGMSIDAIGDRAEYIRNGVKWKTIESNLKKFSEFVRNHNTISFYYSPTISLMSVYTLTDTHKYLYDNGYMKNINDVLFNMLIYPTHLQMGLLPDNIKSEIINKIEKHKIWLKENNANNDIIQQFENLKEFLNKKVDNKAVYEFVHFTKKLDNTRDENFSNTFPELAVWWKEINNNIITVGG